MKLKDVKSNISFYELVNLYPLNVIRPVRSNIYQIVYCFISSSIITFVYSEISTHLNILIHTKLLYHITDQIQDIIDET